MTPAHYARLAAEALAMAAVVLLIGALFVVTPAAIADPSTPASAMDGAGMGEGK